MTQGRAALVLFLLASKLVWAAAPLTRIADIMNHPHPRGTPVMLRATVTAFLPNSYFMTVQQDGLASYVAVIPTYAGPALQPGDRVEIRGTASPGSYAPSINPTEIVRLGPGAMPEPRFVTAANLFSDELENVVVRLRARVTQIHIRTSGQRKGAVELDLLSGPVHFKALIGQAPTEQVQQWVGSEVEVSGVLSTETNGRQQKSGVSIRLTDANGVMVVRSNNFSWTPDRMPISRLLAFNSHTQIGDTAHIVGRVTHIQSQNIYIQDCSGGVPVELALPEKLSMGAMVEVQGQLTVTPSGDYQLGSARLRRTAGVPAVQPEHLTLSSLLNGTKAGLLVELPARLNAVQTIGDQVTLFIDDPQASEVKGYAELICNTCASLPFEPGDTIKLTGVAEYSSGVFGSPLLKLLLRSPADIALLAHRPWQERFPWGPASLVLVLLAAATLVWVRLLRREVQRRTAELVRANAAKGDFLAHMSHEIRTPIAGILGMTRLALETNLDSEQYEYISTAKSSTDSLLSVINDILDFSKIEAGKLSLETIPFRLRDELGEALRNIAPRAQEKNLELLFEVSEDVPDSLIGDPGRLRQVILNLVGNAVKFTARGEVTVEARLERASFKDCRILFGVRDTGLGISPEKQKLIFEEFVQADASTTRQFGGTGLGLSISRRLVEMMNGRIWVESEAGKGSRFLFSAEFSLDPRLFRSRVIDEPVVSLQGLRLLVVDGHPTYRRTLTGSLQSLNVVCLSADSGSSALEILQQQSFDVVLIDKKIPGMGGFDLARQIQARWPQSNIKIVLLTAFGQPGDAKLCLGAGISAYLLKPLKSSDLRAALERLRVETAQPSAGIRLITRHTLAALEHAVLEPARKFKILVAEDNPVNQKLVVRMLEKQGHSVTVAADGNEAVEAFEANRFDMILMDVQMPNKDGFQATVDIRNLEEKLASQGLPPQRIPIIALTAHAMTGYRERCLQQGMDGYLSKPIQPSELNAALLHFSNPQS